MEQQILNQGQDNEEPISDQENASARELETCPAMTVESGLCGLKQIFIQEDETGNCDTFFWENKLLGNYWSIYTDGSKDPKKQKRRGRIWLNPFANLPEQMAAWWDINILSRIMCKMMCLGVGDVVASGGDLI